MKAGICWKSFVYNNPNHINNLVDEGFAFLRIHINLAGFPQETPSRQMIKNFMEKQDGMWCWDSPNFPIVSKRWWSSATNDKVKDAFAFCNKYGWLPIVSFGHSEEQVSWLTRSPESDKWIWLKLMATEFAEYLKATYGFKQVDMESWNEPNECMSPEIYANVTVNLSIGWRAIYPQSSIYGFASNLREQKFLDDLLAIPVFVSAVTDISPHILTDAEWDKNLIQGTYDKCRAKGLKVSYLEVSPLGSMDNLHKFLAKDKEGKVIGYLCDKYALVLWIRNSLIGQNDGITITDALIYDFGNPDKFISVNKEKMDYISTFNKQYTTGVNMQELIPDITYANYFNSLGYKYIAPYHKEIVKDFQRHAFPNQPKEWDGVIGPKTKAKIDFYNRDNFCPEVFEPIKPYVPYSDEQVESLCKLGLADLGQELNRWAKINDFDVLHSLAHAILESASGTSVICKAKNNLYGWTAYDSSPAASASKYYDKKECIAIWSYKVNRYYFEPDGKYYHGNNEHGVNVHYASSPIAGINKAFIVRGLRSKL